MKTTITLLKTTISFVLFLSITINSNAQTIGVSSGYGAISYFDFEENTSHAIANYRSGDHQFVKLDFNAFLPEASFLNLSLKLDRSAGYAEFIGQPMNFMICGVGPQPVFVNPDNMNSKITTYRMSIAVLPFNLKIYNGIKIRSGVQVSRLFRSQIEELESTNLKTENQFFITRATEDFDLFRTLSVGAILELQLGTFKLSKNLQVSPIYNAEVGISEELDSGFGTRAVRQSLGFAFKWGVNPRGI